MEVDRQKVWVVSYYDEGESPVVTVFDNESAADRCYWCFLYQHTKVAIDEVSVYQSFIVNGK